MTGLFSILLPLQVSLTDFRRPEGSGSNVSALIFLGILGAIIVILVLINALRSGTKGSSDGFGGSKFLSRIHFQRMAVNAGLNKDQTKMLEFVFKTDEVTEPEKSLASPSLLDRHFRRSYRLIEQSGYSLTETQNRLSLLFSTRNVLENNPVGVLTSTRQIPEDTNLVISTVRDKINARVLSSSKTESLSVENPKNVLGSYLKLPKGTRVSVFFFTKNNKNFSFESRITGYGTTHGRPTLQLAHVNQLRFLSQRRFRRRQTVIACFLFLVYVENVGKKKRMIVDKRRLSGTIVNISVGGCSIKTTAPIKVGAMFKIEFYHDENNVAALGHVLRSNKAGGNTVLHIKFLKVSKRSMNIINAFVYDYAVSMNDAGRT